MCVHSPSLSCAHLVSDKTPKKSQYAASGQLGNQVCCKCAAGRATSGQLGMLQAASWVRYKWPTGYAASGQLDMLLVANWACLKWPTG